MMIKNKLFALKNRIQNNSNMLSRRYVRVYKKYSFKSFKCKDARQFEAYITKLYHAVEKGLSYINYKPGFGKKNIIDLLSAMERYSLKYDTSAFFYETALCVLNEYVRKNKKYGEEDCQLEQRIKSLKGKPNNCGGVIEFVPFKAGNAIFSYEEFVKSRHSIRHFSNETVDNAQIIKAIELAQYTPSACNRQGWNVRLFSDSKTKESILANQNGNRGFGNEIQTLIVITGDLRCFNSNRELHQVFIDGGMYAMNVLHALHSKNIATIPLSAALTSQQEKKVRKIAKIEDYEVLIMFIGCGGYPTKCITTKSERRQSCVVNISDVTKK